MEFNIQTSGSTTFTLAGYAGSGTVSNSGTKVINGSATVQLVMHTVQPSAADLGFATANVWCLVELVLHPDQISRSRHKSRCVDDPLKALTGIRKDCREAVFSAGHFANVCFWLWE